jgi:hypothetical protein
VYNERLRSGTGLEGDILLYRIMLPPQTDLTMLLLDQCPCKDSDDADCCDVAELANMDERPFKSISDLNAGNTVDIVGNTDWFALCLANLNDSQISFIRDKVSIEMQSKTDMIRSRIVSLRDRDMDALLHTGDIDTEFTTAYKDVYFAMVDAGDSALGLTMPAGPKRNAILDSFKSFARFAVAELWMKTVTSECLLERYDAANQLMYDVCQLVYLMFKFDIASLFTASYSSLNVALSSEIQAMPLMYTTNTDELFNMSVQLQSKLKKTGDTALTKNDEVKRLEQIHSTLGAQHTKYDNESKQVRNALQLEIRLVVVLTCACIMFGLYMLLNNGRQVNGFIVAIIVIAYMVLIFSESITLMSRK